MTTVRMFAVTVVTTSEVFMQPNVQNESKETPVAGTPIEVGLNTLGFFSSATKGFAATQFAAISQRIAAARVKFGYRDVEMVQAASAGATERVQHLLDQGVDPSAPHATRDNYTPLHRAAAVGDVAMVDLFIRHAQKNPQHTAMFQTGELGQYRTALALAYEERHDNVVRRILKSKLTNPLALDAMRLTVLDLMAYDGRADLLKYAGEKHASDIFDTARHDPTRLPLSFHAINGQSDNRMSVLRVLEQNGVRLSGRFGPDDTTLLHVAAAANDAKVLKHLVGRIDFDVNATDARGMTPLHIAANNGRADLVKILLENGANPNATSIHKPTQELFGTTPLMMAAARGHEGAVKALVSDPQTKVSQAMADTKMTAFDYAQRNGFPGLATVIEGALREQMIVAAGSRHARIQEMLRDNTPQKAARAAAIR